MLAGVITSPPAPIAVNLRKISDQIRARGQEGKKAKGK
jgi:hypothetical protein